MGYTLLCVWCEVLDMICLVWSILYGIFGIGNLVW